MTPRVFKSCFHNTNLRGLPLTAKITPTVRFESQATGSNSAFAQFVRSVRFVSALEVFPAGGGVRIGREEDVFPSGLAERRAKELVPHLQVETSGRILFKNYQVGGSAGEKFGHANPMLAGLDRWIDGIVRSLSLEQASEVNAGLLLPSVGPPQPLGILAFSKTLDCGLRLFSPSEVATVSSIPRLGGWPANPGVIFVQHLPLERGPQRTRVHVNRVQTTWEFFRACGINIPLLLLYALAGHRVTASPTVPLASLRRTPVSQKPFLELDFDRVEFDLDDTLVSNGRSVPEMLNFAEALSSRFSAGLLTRNPGDLPKILREAGIVPDLFDSHTFVGPAERKSSFVGPRSLFVDNEFNQRLDVWENASVPSLDLDQIDFIL